ncbi:MAG: hypothetical protein AAF467_05160 [Actinomycetota bacterium]
MTDQPFSLDVSHAFPDDQAPAPPHADADADADAEQMQEREIADAQQPGEDAQLHAGQDPAEASPDIPSMADLDALSADLDEIDGELARMDARAAANANASAGTDDASD